MSRFVYVADPMCSWCYGFAPQLRALVDEDGAQVEVVVGGLRPGTREPMSADQKEQIRGYWKDVQRRSGQPFAERGADALNPPDFVYDTEPACRAVVTLRELANERVLEYFAAIQRAFYRDGRDVTHAGVLAELAGDFGTTRADFDEAFFSDAKRAATQRDFETVQRWGVRGFPTLLLAKEQQLFAVARGFCSIDELRANVRTAQRQSE